jgi:hypothetical protein
MRNSAHVFEVVGCLLEPMQVVCLLHVPVDQGI